jgi:beta-glucosidase
MTLREKLGQCLVIEPCFCLEERVGEEFGESYDGVMDPAYLGKLLDEYKIGSFLFGGVSRVGDGSPQAWAEYISKVNEHASGTRHKIPLLFGIDAVHGVNFMKGSTIFSHNLGVAATWNPSLAKDYAGLVSAELSAIGFNLNFAPTIDVARDPRWGRVYESLGEDPYLSSMFSQALVEGIQGSGDLAACAKHFIGYGESRNGMDRTQADLSERSILETHAPPFEAAIASDVLAIMVSGGDVNAVPVPASKKLLRNLLRDRLGFKGVTVSDWEDVYRLHSRHKVAVDRRDAIARAFNAGLDMNMAVADIGAVDTMVELVEEGKISIERVDEAAGNVLSMKIRLGLFEKAAIDVQNSGALVGSIASKGIAKQLASQSITLLKNEGNLLPLSKLTSSILVTGSSANSKRHLCAGWTLGWSGADENELDCKTVLEALGDVVSPETTITHVESIEQLKDLDLINRTFDVCVSVLSEEPHAEWFGDSMDLKLEDDEAEMLAAASATGIPVVMVSLLGRPLNISWAAENLAAILWAYSPGTEGADAIAEILFGDFNPCGRLPISFPRDATQIPVVYNARNYQCDEINTRYDPLYPFGYGLSYTRFEYSGLLVPEKVELGEGVDVSVTVRNVGDVDGCEVVQLYLRDQYASVTRPLKLLKAFARADLRAGEEQQVLLSVSPRELSLYNEELELVEEAREIEVIVADQCQGFKLGCH